MTTKLKNLLEQYEAREQQVEKLLKHKDLENQLANAKFQQSELKLAELSERHKSEKAIVGKILIFIELINILFNLLFKQSMKIIVWS